MRVRASSVRAGDDGVAMHGEYYAVAAADPSNRSVVVASTAGFPFDRNDSLTFYSSELECWGSGVIQKLYSVDQPPESEGQINTALNKMKYDDADFMQVSTPPVSSAVFSRDGHFESCGFPLKDDMPGQQLSALWG